jgi:hypothetical protein
LLATCSVSSAFGQATSLSSIAIGDRGSIPSGTDSADLVVDVVRGTCGSGTDATPEPFFDSTVQFGIKNALNRTIRVESYRVTVKRGAGSRNVRSRWFAPAGQLVISPDESGTISGLLFDKRDGKVRVPGSRIFLEELGFRTLQFEIRVRGGTQSHRLTGAIGVSFRDDDRCTTQ